MRFFRLQGIALVFAVAFALGFVLTTQQPSAYCQEVTGGIQGTVKDPSGAVVPKARVTITGTTLIGSKELVTGASGYYRFANLPPGTYTVVVKAEGFETSKREGLEIEVGHLPTVDLILKVGATATTVEVTGAAPVIDTTTTENMTNLNSQTLQNAPTGITYQSVIQYAPMARNEPLAGMTVNGMGFGGTGGSMPGSSGNGQQFGYSIGGAADSESSYLVEGQDTENISGGYSNANVPMDFIDEVQMKTSGISAEYGGALGGVVNVILKKGGNQFHGSLFSSYESSGTDANPANPYLRFDPTSTGTAISDPDVQNYQAQKAHFRDLQPGVLVGGPIYKDKLWFVAGFNPLYNAVARTVNFGANDGNAGNQYFTQDKQTYYGYGRIDAALSQKIRVYGSWLYQYGREAGDSFPIGDPVGPESSYLNTAILSPLSLYSHGLGWSAPNATYNVGADITITQHLISTTRYGYFFDNYHDFGWPTGTPNLVWNTDSVGQVDYTGAPLPANLQQNTGTTTVAYNSTYTQFNANKHYQLNQDFAFYKGGWWGTHNFKFGYQLNHLVNVIDQNGNVPQAFLYLGPPASHAPGTSTGVANCTLLGDEYQYTNTVTNPNPPPPTLSTTVYPCTGKYGYIVVQDFSTILLNSKGQATPASDWNHALYVQDSWNIGKGLTLDVGLRIERETLPAPGGVNVSTINFPWSDKVEPRLGAAWDPSRRGKYKIFGSYGAVTDVMKLLLAQTSWGAQAFEQCSYALGPDGTAAGYSNSDIDLAFVAGRACPNGLPTTQANFANSKVPTSLTDKGTGVSLIENVNERPWEPVAPNVKPYRQHEYVVGFDYQISRDWAFEARYDRRRLDHILEDASLSDKVWGETYTVVNPGEGVNDNIDDYATYLASLGQAFGVPGWAFSDTKDYGAGAAFGTCPSCPANPKAIRNYDGAEFRFTMSPVHGWASMISYTYSSMWGNYAGLTTTDQTDGGITGRNSPDTTRSFDEPFYYFGANGKSTDGPMPTDRPNVFKGFATYTFHWWKGQTTTLGLLQQLLQGSPVSSYIDLLESYGEEPYEATYVYGRGNWANMTQNPTTGAITIGTPYARRTPWFTQSDLNASHTIRTGDHESISFEGTALNLLNQRAVTAYWQGMNSVYSATPLYPGVVPGTGTNPTTNPYVPVSLANGALLYQELETGYNPQTWINGNNGEVPSVIPSSWYGQPYLHQLARSIRLGVHYTF